MMTPRRIALAVALLGLAPVAPAAAAPERRGGPERVQTQQYVYSHGVDTWHWTVSAEDVLPALVFTPRPGDRFMHLAADDASGQPVFVHVRQEAEGNGEDLAEHFCDTADILELVSDEPVRVYVFSGACQNHTTGFATTGTLTATFARRL
jgi:hypothetical protein